MNKLYTWSVVLYSVYTQCLSIDGKASQERRRETTIPIYEGGIYKIH